MADPNVIAAALAAQVTEFAGLRSLAQARDSVNPPCAVVLPGASPFLSYGDTMDGALSMRMQILVLITDAAPLEMSQRALNAYLGIGENQDQSIPNAIQMDPTLGGTVHWCVPLTADSYGRIDYAGVIYFGARINCSVGTI